MPAREFVDSNIWLYALVQVDDDKADDWCHLASQFVGLLTRPVINSQVIREVSRNLLKKSSLTEKRLQQLISDLYLSCEVLQSNLQQHLQASQLRLGAFFSFWDSLIVAAALDARCDTLYSEDMQHGRLIDGRLSIVNPLLG